MSAKFWHQDVYILYLIFKLKRSLYLKFDPNPVSAKDTACCRITLLYGFITKKCYGITFTVERLEALQRNAHKTYFQYFNRNITVLTSYINSSVIQRKHNEYFLLAVCRVVKIQALKKIPVFYHHYFIFCFILFLGFLDFDFT